LHTARLDTIVRWKRKEPRKLSPPRLIVGISGASGAALGVRTLKACRELKIESHLIVSKAGVLTLAEETGLSLAEVSELADVTHKAGDIGACVASGSYPAMGMIVAPCSVRTMSEISTGVTSSLLTRSADVTLKERRPLVLVVRETPFHLGHLRTMTQLAEMGATIAPPVPAFYTKPQSIEDIVDQAVGRALDVFGLSLPSISRWGADVGPQAG
jgi:4-hydroxy-3-polyprenylbenzoate decarboxylase